MLQLGEQPLQTKSALAEESLRAVYQQLYLPVFRYLMCKTRNLGEAEDLTQETSSASIAISTISTRLKIQSPGYTRSRTISQSTR
jgi:hypothetical protein